MIVVAGCSSGALDVDVVGEPPAECEAVPVGGNDDVGMGSEALTTVIARLPVGDADCTAPTTIVEQTTAFVMWTEAGAVRDELVPAEQRSTWTRSGDVCRVRVAITYRGGPAGRAGRVRPCDARMLSAAWASFADLPIAIDSVTIDGEPAAAAWTAAWADGTDASPACAPAATIDRDALGLEVATEIHIAIADWRRLQSTAPPMVAIRAAITVR